MRWLSLAAGICLVAIAFAAATRVTNTQEGQIAEVVTLLAGLAGISLLLYGLLAGTRRPAAKTNAISAAGPSSPAVRSVRDLVTGAAGIALALVLLGGLAASAGVAWAGLGLVLLLPMIAGSAYLCVRFIRAPIRSWKLELWTSGRRNPAEPRG